MKPTLTAILVAVALSLAAAGARATDSTPVRHGASSVADMLQSKQDAELRAQFAREGRWDEIRKLDEVTAQRLQAQREQRYLSVNKQLAHGASVDGLPIDAGAPPCDPDAMHVR